MPGRRQDRIYLLLMPAIALLIAGAVLLYWTSQRSSLTVHVDGRPIEVSGQFQTVGQALEAAGIDLRSEDYVWPAVTTAPLTQGRIIVRSARPIEATLDGQLQIRWTQQDNLASFLAEQDIRLSRSAVVYHDGRQVLWPTTMDSLAFIELGQSVEISSQLTVQIDAGQGPTDHAVQASTVGQSLIAAGVEIYEADGVEPALSDRLRAGQRIVIDRASPVVVDLDQQELAVRTSQREVAGVLAELGVGLVGQDQASPGLDQSLDSNSQILVERASSRYEVYETSLPFSSQLVPQDTLEIDQRSLVSAGSPGTLSQLWRIEAAGTEAVSQTLVGEWISRPPVDEIVGYGTNIVVRLMDTPDGTISYWRKVRMRVTAYTAADAGKPRSHPAYGITASGLPAGFGIVAVDPDVVPFRSQVYVPGYGIGIAGDTGGGVKGRWMDLGYDEGEIVAWNGYVDVYYLTPVPDNVNYLIPTSLP